MNFKTLHPNPFISAEEIRILQTEQFRKHLRYCKEHSPFYREKLNHIYPDSFTLDDVSSLPLTTKDDLSSRSTDFLACPEQEICDIVYTSGSTGSPCAVQMTRNDLDRVSYNEECCYGSIGTTASDRVLLTCTLDRCFMAGMAYFLGGVRNGASMLRSGLFSVEGHLWTIQNAHPTMLIGVPSFLVKLGELAQQKQVPVDFVRKIEAVGEPVRTSDFSLNGLGEQLRKYYPNAEIFATYASTEMAASFCECSEHRGGHLIPELIYVELLDDYGVPVKPGEVGEVVVTPFSVTGMPLIRFRTGDLAVMDDSPCKCGRNTFRLGPIAGRKKHLLKYKGTSIYPQVIYNVLAAIPEVDNYYLTVEGKNLSDKVMIHVSFRQETDGLLEHVRHSIQSACRASLPVIREDAVVVNAKVFGSSRKPQHFFDLRENSGVEPDPEKYLPHSPPMLMAGSLIRFGDQCAELEYVIPSSHVFMQEDCTLHPAALIEIAAQSMGLSDAYHSQGKNPSGLLVEVGKFHYCGQKLPPGMKLHIFCEKSDELPPFRTGRFRIQENDSNGAAVAEGDFKIWHSEKN